MVWGCLVSSAATVYGNCPDFRGEVREHGPFPGR